MAQLIYTTHDTTLMDKKFFRRDQIWFVQKDELGHSELCALSDFKVRSDASFEKDYLAGVRRVCVSCVMATAWFYKAELVRYYGNFLVFSVWKCYN